jgi:hypothetical protein
MMPVVGNAGASSQEKPPHTAPIARLGRAEADALRQPQQRIPTDKRLPYSVLRPSHFEFRTKYDALAKYEGLGSCVS